jgi:glucose dehydrogenase
MILTDLRLDGVERKVILHAPKNGFFYVLDRRTGVGRRSINLSPNHVPSPASRI